MEKEDRNQQAPLPSQGLWLLNNSPSHLISAPIVSTAPGDGSPEPNCPVLTQSPPEPPGSCGLAPPRSQDVCSCPEHAAKPQGASFSKDSDRAGSSVPLAHRARKTDVPDQRLSRTNTGAGTGLLLPGIFLALQRRLVCDKPHGGPLSPGPAAGLLERGTRLQLERRTLECDHCTGPTVPSERCRLSHWPQALAARDLVSAPSPRKGRGCTRWPPRPLEVLPNWAPKPHPSCPVMGDTPALEGCKGTPVLYSPLGRPF